MVGVTDFAGVAAWAGSKPVAIICVDNLVTGHAIGDSELEALRHSGGNASVSPLRMPGLILSFKTN